MAAKKAQAPARKAAAKKAAAKKATAKKAAAKKPAVKIACPICKQEVGGRLRACRNCSASILCQEDSEGTPLYCARVEFTTSGKVNPDDNDQPEPVFWYSIYPMFNEEGMFTEEGIKLEDKTLFATDTSKNRKGIAYMERTFNGYVSVERFVKLVQAHLI